MWPSIAEQSMLSTRSQIFRMEFFRACNGYLRQCRQFDDNRTKPKFREERSRTEVNSTDHEHFPNKIYIELAVD